VAIETGPSPEPETRSENGLGSIPGTVKRNTVLLSAGQTLYTVVAQINVLLGAFMILGLTGDVRLAGLGTAIAWGGRLLIVYHSGKLMDRLGRVKVLQLGTGLSLGGAIIVATSLFANSLLGTVSGLVIYGLGAGATNQNRVAVADMFPAKRRNRLPVDRQRSRGACGHALRGRGHLARRIPRIRDLRGLLWTRDLRSPV